MIRHVTSVMVVVMISTYVLHQEEVDMESASDQGPALHAVGIEGAIIRPVAAAVIAPSMENMAESVVTATLAEIRTSVAEEAVVTTVEVKTIDAVQIGSVGVQVPVATNSFPLLDPNGSSTTLICPKAQSKVMLT